VPPQDVDVLPPADAVLPVDVLLLALPHAVHPALNRVDRWMRRWSLL
jgi:hypothetical protein